MPTNYSACAVSKIRLLTALCALALLLPFGVQAQSCVPAPSGLVSWWQAEGNTSDSAGNNAATVIGNVTYSVGRVGQAFSFDGSGDALLLGNPGNLQLQDLTIEAWIKRGSATQASLSPGGGQIFAYGFGGYAFGFLDDGRLFLTRVGISQVTSTVHITDTNYHHVAMTKTGETVVFYVDGMAYLAASFSSVFTFESQLAIGARGDNLGNSFLGRIDELDIFDRALNGSEVLAIYNAGASGKCGAAPSMTSQPISQTVNIGNRVAFYVVASGTAPLRYQWRINETNIFGATNRSFRISSVNMSDAGDYSVVVSNQTGFVISSNGTLTVNPASPCASVLAGLVSWWQAEDSALDSGSTNDGAMVGDVTYTSGKVGSAFSFDGGGDAVRVGNPTNLRLQDFTIEAWIRRASSTRASLDPSGGEIFGYGAGGYIFGLVDDGHLILSAVEQSEVRSSVQITDTSFHHVAVTKIDSSVVFYVDGVAYLAPSYNPGFSFTSQAAIGARGDTLANSFLGLIDEVGVFNRALSASEIQSIYIAGNSGRCGTAPSATTQPASLTVTANDDATFSVVATGTKPLSYQWIFNTTNIVGATNAFLTLTHVQSSQAGNYSVLVANPAGSITSSNAVLTVNPPPPCLNAPSNLVSWWRAEGDSSDFVGANNGTLIGDVAYASGRVGVAFNFDGGGDVVRVGNPANLRLQNFTIEAWVKRASTTQASLDPSGGEIFGYGYGGYIFGLVDDGHMILSAVGQSQVSSTVQITDTSFHHLAVTKTNATVVFYVDGVGYPAPSYDPGFSFTSEAAIGGRGDTLANSFLGMIDEVAVFDRALSASEIQSIYGASGLGKCPIPSAPFVVTQPASQTVTVGSTAVLSVTAGGTSPFSYQWSFASTNIVGATNASLTLSNVQFSQAGSYSVVVSNAVDSATSSNATLTVNFPPAVVRVESTNAMAGGPVSVRIILVANGNENALGFSLNFNTQRLTFAGIALGDGTTGASLLPNTSQTNLGRLGIAVSLSSGTSFSAGTQEVVRVDFLSPILTGSTPVNTSISFGNSPTVRQLSDAQAHALPATYVNGTVSLMPSDIESDVAPRPTGDQDVTITDWVQAGRFVAGLATAANGGEFQRADCAPHGSLGDGILKVTDWVQAGRYAAGLDPLTVTGGPTSPVAGASPAQRGGITVASVRSVTVGNPTAIQGLAATVPVHLEAQGNETALGFSLSFDAAAFTYSGSSLGGGAGGATLNVNTNLIGSGKLGVTLGLPTGSFAAGSREMIKVKLTPNATVVGTYNLNFGDQPVPRAISDPGANELTADYVPGAVIVNPLPALKIAQTGSSIKLSWPQWAEGFNVQVSADLLSASNWTNFVSSVQTNGGELVVTIPASETTKFFRLHHP